MQHKIAQTAVLAVVLAAGLWSQPASPQPATTPEFEVASIKAAAPMNRAQLVAGKMHIGVNIDGARVDIGNFSLMQLLCFAYSVKPYQVSGPDWLGRERFDVLAKLPEGATKDQAPVMLQALLADRFKLTLRRENKEQPVYALVVGKNGPKLKPSTEADAPGADAQPTPATGPPPPPPGFGPPPGAGPGSGQLRVTQDGKGMSVSGTPMGAVHVSMGPDGVHLEALKATMPMFADMLSQFVDRPVVDMTELKGTYEVAVDLSLDDMRIAAKAVGLMMGGPGGGMPPPPGFEAGRGPAAGTAPSSDSAPSAIFANIQKLGLKLDPRKAPLETLVIEHAEKLPTEN